MKVIELKATLYRSNPAVIRQFTFPQEATAAQLEHALLILIGRKSAPWWRIKSGERVVPEETAAKELFPIGGEEWPASAASVTCELGTKREAGKDGSGASLVFRIVPLGEKEQEEACPVLVRWRGRNLPEEEYDVARFNQLQRWWDQEDYLQTGLGRRFPEEQRLDVSARMVARELKRWFSAEKERVSPVAWKLNYQNAFPIRQLVAADTAQELKVLAERLGIRLPSGLRKAQLVDVMTEELTKEPVMERSFDCMTSGEYRLFQEVCTGGEQTGGELSRLLLGRLVAWKLAGSRAGGFGMGYRYETRPTQELLEFYEGWLEQGKEEPFLRRAQVFTTIYGSLCLYGCLERAEWLRLAGEWFQGVFPPRELERLWEEYLNYYITWESPVVGGQRWPEVLYAKKSLAREDVSRATRKFRQLPHYRPSLEEVNRIETEGLCFAKQDREALENFLEHRCDLYSDAVEGIAGELYHMLHCGAAQKEIVAYARNRLGIWEKKRQDELWRMLERLQPSVRQIGLGGYTAEEWQALSKKGGQPVQGTEQKGVSP